MAFFIASSVRNLINWREETKREGPENFLIDGDDDQDETHTPGILANELCQLNKAQRNGFLAGVSMLCLLSLVGNTSTLVVNMRRRLRPFFRACLISLAISDLSSTIFLTTAYMTQFSTPYLQIWLLGGDMCKLVPYATTAAILSSSMTLIAIALDRYFAIMRAAIGRWNPSVLSSGICMLSIWASSLGISAPMLFVYNLEWVLVYKSIEEDATVAATTTSEVKVHNDTLTMINGGTEAVGRLIPMCISDDKHFVHYYVLLFVLIFLPCIVGFLWLNAVIARKLWQRRHPITATELHSTIPQPMLRMPARASPPTQAGAMPTSGGPTAREARHVRMFIVILLMMTVFIFLRLPAWIFFVMRMYGSYSKHAHWILYCCFGILNLISCVLNPLFYTFLSETLSAASKLKRNILKCVCFCGSDGIGVGKPADRSSIMPGESSGRCFFGLLKVSLHCQRVPPPQADDDEKTMHVKAIDEECREPSQRRRQRPKQLSFEKDEGVDCSEDVDSLHEYYDYRQRIYTIFSASLVSSSLSSHLSCEQIANDN